MNASNKINTASSVKAIDWEHQDTDIERMGKRIILPIGPSDTGGTQLMPRTKVVPMDPTLVHAPVCATCVMKTMCNGVSARYLEHYGSAGLAPILA